MSEYDSLWVFVPNWQFEIFSLFISRLVIYWLLTSGFQYRFGGSMDSRIEKTHAGSYLFSYVVCEYVYDDGS